MNTVDHDRITPSAWRMSNMEHQALDNSFRNWKDHRMPGEEDWKAFELFCTNIILKDSELSDNEIASGLMGGGGDGGVDSFYFFLDRILVTNQPFTPQGTTEARLVIIQSTRTAGFDETKIDKLEKFCHYLFGWKDLSKQNNLSRDVRERMTRFRTHFEAIYPQDHTLNVEFHYATRSTHPPSSNVLTRVEEIRAYVKGRSSRNRVRWLVESG